MAPSCAARQATLPCRTTPSQRTRLASAELKDTLLWRVRRRPCRRGSLYENPSVTCRPDLSASCLKESTSTQLTPWSVKKIDSDEELLKFLQIVLQGYFEGDHSRHVNSFMRQKLEQEMGRLKSNYAPKGDKLPAAMCLIAVGNGTEDVVGGCEICVSENLSGVCPYGVPVSEKDGFYIQNLIVKPDLRRKGIGNLLLDALVQLLTKLGGTAVYAHVEAQNEEALAFYDNRGFEIIKEVKEFVPQANLGRVLLLKLEIEQGK